jgi:hypothetical protein
MQHNAKYFVLQLGSIASLYLSISFLLVLLFATINLQFPDSLDGYWQIESANEMIRVGFAMVVVFFPTYLILTRYVNRNRRQAAEGSYLSLTKWLIYLSLLVAGGVLLGDLVAIIIAFLNGELTMRFLIKAVVLFVVVGSAFMYYLLDARGYWMEHEKESIRYGIVASVLVVLALGYAFTLIDTPSEVRERKADNKQLTDLQDIQWRLEDQLRMNDELPTDLATVYVGQPVPSAPLNREAYEYELTEDGFRLCATFALSSGEAGNESLSRPFYPEEKGAYIIGQNWDHDAGRYCFERTIQIPE